MGRDYSQIFRRSLRMISTATCAGLSPTEIGPGEVGRHIGGDQMVARLPARDPLVGRSANALVTLPRIRPNPYLQIGHLPPQSAECSSLDVGRVHGVPVEVGGRFPDFEDGPPVGET